MGEYLDGVGVDEPLLLRRLDGVVEALAGIQGDVAVVAQALSAMARFLFLTAPAAPAPGSDEQAERLHRLFIKLIADGPALSAMPSGERIPPSLTPFAPLRPVSAAATRLIFRSGRFRRAPRSSPRPRGPGRSVVGNRSQHKKHGGSLEVVPSRCDLRECPRAIIDVGRDLGERREVEALGAKRRAVGGSGGCKTVPGGNDIQPAGEVMAAARLKIHKRPRMASWLLCAGSAQS